MFLCGKTLWNIKPVHQGLYYKQNKTQRVGCDITIQRNNSNFCFAPTTATQNDILLKMVRKTADLQLLYFAQTLKIGTVSIDSVIVVVARLHQQTKRPR